MEFVPALQLGGRPIPIARHRLEADRTGNHGCDERHAPTALIVFQQICLSQAHLRIPESLSPNKSPEEGKTIHPNPLESTPKIPFRRSIPAEKSRNPKNSENEAVRRWGEKWESRLLSFSDLEEKYGHLFGAGLL
ncbi:hypothetical protein ACLOJK_026206 [Asimina triloba]